MFRHLAGRVAPGVAVAGLCGIGSRYAALAEGTNPSALPDMVAAQHLRSVALRARNTLADPPAMLQRCARCDWKAYASPNVVRQLETQQTALRDALQSAAQKFQAAQKVDMPTIAGLYRAAEQAETAVAEARTSAASGAASVPWHKAMSKARLERANDAGEASRDVSALNGKVVGLYFTASWCGPCHQFSPYLLNLYKRATQQAAGAGQQAFEVVLVSWDESEGDRLNYAKSHGMEWLALAHEQGDLADLLTLRYAVKAIPSLVVLEVSEDGREARVLATAEEGRTDILRGGAQWMRRVLSR